MHYDIREARAEIDALKHDIERHIAITTEQANRIVELENALRETPCQCHEAQGNGRDACARCEALRLGRQSDAD